MTPAAYALLNYPALRHNLAKVREPAPSAKIMAVIKANAYGHGLIEVAKTLVGVDAFAVARVDEGVRLRQAGTGGCIVVLEGFTCGEELQLLLEHGLEAVVHGVWQLDLLEETQAAGKLPVWLKLDTGMGRLGFTRSELPMAYRRLSRCHNVADPVHLMTHLANADDLQDPKTGQQLALFHAATVDYSAPKTLANSAGILAWPDSIADWVRPGIMLYGVSPFPGQCGRQLGLQPVMSLHSRLIAVKTIAAGDSVGYGGQWTARRSTRLGVVAIGYGDGYPRQAKTGTPVLVNDVRTALIGRVSMDMITVDLENCPEARPGDPVTLWGGGLPVEEIACCADTIPYTLLCGITQRVQIVAR